MGNLFNEHLTVRSTGEVAVCSRAQRALVERINHSAPAAVNCVAVCGQSHFQRCTPSDGGGVENNCVAV